MLDFSQIIIFDLYLISIALRGLVADWILAVNVEAGSIPAPHCTLRLQPNHMHVKRR